MGDTNVLRVNSVEEQADYVKAVAEILRNIQAEHKGPTGDPITLHEIAEAVDISLGTISLAANKKTVLNTLYLNRLGKRFGPHTLDPYVNLCGGRIVPLDRITERDVLPFLSRATLKVAEARDPQSPGGVREVHTERLGYLDDLRAVVREASALICQIEKDAA